MMLQFFDMQDESNPANGTTIKDQARLVRLLEGARKREPFFFELEAENGYKLLVGIGQSIGCVQFSSTNGSPPYLMAVGNDAADERSDDYQDFLAGGTLTPVPRHFCLPFDTMRQIAVYFMETGEPNPIVSWEQI
ncbi:MAG TPA: Imm1 family immunity protein [Myxococcaceae bacterium]|nr:Imm1 family immunity protein [Myxococcaceae bacterium]